MTSGTASMPPTAASAPRRPKKRSPNISARLTTFGPGSTWLEREHLDELLARQPALALDQLALRDREHAAEALQREPGEGEEEVAGIEAGRPRDVRRRLADRRARIVGSSLAAVRAPPRR